MAALFTDLAMFKHNDLVSFLHHRGIAYDVLTDEHLHEEGVSCLSPDRCVITGTHPEYYSSAMLRGINEFTHSGGRLVYLVSMFAIHRK